MLLRRRYQSVEEEKPINPTLTEEKAEKAHANDSERVSEKAETKKPEAKKTAKKK